ncbi:MAG: hypothetical protein IJN19_01400 [Opitutales bacterium]|nr:hypothetical protein [Opitutales bacterium]
MCKFVFDEEKEGVKWHELREEWCCPRCRARKCSCVPVRAPASDASPPPKCSGGR